MLGFDEKELARFRRFIREPYGMVLVTGPTGSGKTTTLYAALSEIKNEEDKIITIEDPVEYQLKGITQIPVNEKKGLTFARGLRSILRHDPDKIMVGEIRDAETADIAIQSALTGHLVFTTVHANNVIDVLGRFLNMKIEPYNFVSALNCVHGPAPGAHDLRALQAPGARARRELLVESGPRRPTPTATSGSTRARAAWSAAAPATRAASPSRELLDLSDNVRELILGRRSSAEIKRAAREEGMIFMRESARHQGAGRAHHAPGDQQGHLRGGAVSTGAMAPAGGRGRRAWAAAAAWLRSREPARWSRSRCAPRVGGRRARARASGRGWRWPRPPRWSCRRARCRSP